MITSMDKALTALIFSAIYLINFFLGTDIGLPTEIVAWVVSILAPLAVYLVPNKQA